MPEEKTEATASKSIQSPNLVPLAVALIAACASIASVFVTWFLTERIRTEIANQTLALERVKVDISSQALALERVKVEIAAATQRTAERSAEVGRRVDQARLDLEKRNAQSTEHLGSQKVQIDDKRSNTDEIRLTAEFARLSNDLRPAFIIDCKAYKVNSTTSYQIHCQFNNKGVHRASITPTDVSMVDRNTQEVLPDAIAGVDNAKGNAVLAGGSGSNNYTIRLTEEGAKHSQQLFRFNFTAVTDQIAVNMAKRLSKGVLTDEDLSKLTVETYIIIFWM